MDVLVGGGAAENLISEYVELYAKDVLSGNVNVP